MSTTIVKEIGALVPTFKNDKIVILFGPQAPKELREMSVIHEFEDLTDEPLKVGGKIEFGDEVFTITAVGNKANDNFKELGHISIYFQENNEDILPGAVFASPDNFPTINEGTVIRFKD
ncbi:PTS glucitol/sorbitol transporter subunit IIA [Pseudalkalibacillus caeni]|uniref:PTS sorbitol transporter subunit IIA n=1 Tax=Exobacillus caeni TaxID=2574798 RepID=A0A5R9F7S3_9BACL|nr:PTS glucitol/sorbitol transporter subunit IIA [Pseudalkalibacillus caeni]TLS38376.1 PTS sorbitol transporter subunit IIA [Pseudalkalibacillus caeni]